MAIYLQLAFQNSVGFIEVFNQLALHFYHYLYLMEVKTGSANSQYSIFWSSTNVDYIKIEYSIDQGLSWTQIATSVFANVGHFDEWIIPNTPSLFCKVKITDINNVLLYDVSDQYFHILVILWMLDLKISYRLNLVYHKTTPTPSTQVQK